MESGCVVGNGELLQLFNLDYMKVVWIEFLFKRMRLLTRDLRCLSVVEVFKSRIVGASNVSIV